MHPRFYPEWQKYIYNLDEALEAMSQKNIIAVGVAPYQRIIPGIFLDRQTYQIYAVKSSADLEVLRKYAYIFCLEEKLPKIAAKVQSTGYLLKNFAFQSFLKSRQNEFALLFYQTTPPIVDYLNQEKIPWIGNDPKVFEPVLHKEGFREVLRKLKLSYLPDWNLPKGEFLKKSYQEISRHWQRPVVCQPADYEISGGTLFIHNEEDLKKAHEIIKTNEKFATKVNTIKLTPFITGDSLSMLGCVTDQGVLTSTLQLQLIDIPETLHGAPTTGLFCGHDWGFSSWDSGTEADAQVIVELVGEYLGKRGYKGIFGIDFMYDKRKRELFPLECNPRFTGTIPIYSQLNLLAGVPPIDFFTLASYMNIPLEFDFDAVNEAWKTRINASHVSLSPFEMQTMNISLPAGIYSYNHKTAEITYERPGAFLHELRGKQEFIIIDSVPIKDQPIMQTVPRMFKFIFPHSIADTGSNTIKPEFGEILNATLSLLK